MVADETEALSSNSGLRISARIRATFLFFFGAEREVISERFQPEKKDFQRHRRTMRTTCESPFLRSPFELGLLDKAV